MLAITHIVVLRWEGSPPALECWK